MSIKFALLATAIVFGAPAFAVNKCTGPDGKSVFQDAPCMGSGQKIDVRPASGNADRSTVPAPAPATVPSPQFRAGEPPAQPPKLAAVPSKSVLEVQADQCLAWYKPLLRDPAHAYYTEPKLEDKRVLRMTLHATNGYGGFVARQAACEFDNGKLSVDWTKIQAKRLEWAVN